MDFQQTRNIYLVDEFGDEDDVFYSELRKQVLQLTAEDEDEEQVHEFKNVNTVKHVARNGGYYDWSGNKEDFAAPIWMLNLWRNGNGNGTGVFIPQVVQTTTKKKNRSRRKRNERGRRAYIRVEKM